MSFLTRLRTNLIFRKAMFTFLTAPLLYKCVWAWQWQARRKIEKQQLIDDRLEKLMRDTVTINDLDADLPLKQMDRAEFDKQWLYTPVKMKGIIDNGSESQIQRTVKGDQGLEILAPLYTGVDDKTGKLKGVMINRGRIPVDYKDSKLHYAPTNQEVEVEGVIFYDEGQGEEKENV